MRLIIVIALATLLFSCLKKPNSDDHAEIVNNEPASLDSNPLDSIQKEIRDSTPSDIANDVLHKPSYENRSYIEEARRRDEVLNWVNENYKSDRQRKQETLDWASEYSGQKKSATKTYQSRDYDVNGYSLEGEYVSGTITMTGSSGGGYLEKGEEEITVYAQWEGHKIYAIDDEGVSYSLEVD